MTAEERLQRKERRQSRRGRSQPRADQPMRRRGSGRPAREDRPIREAGGGAAYDPLREENVTPFRKSSGNWLSDIISGLGKGMSDTLGGLGKGMSDTIGGLGKGMSDTIGGVGRGAVDTFDGLGEGMKDTFGGLGGGGRMMGEELKKVGNPFGSGKSDERQAEDKSSWWRNPFWGSGKSEDLDSMDDAQLSKLEADAVEMDKIAARIRKKISRRRRTFTIDGVKSRHKPLGRGDRELDDALSRFEDSLKGPGRK